MIKNETSMHRLVVMKELPGCDGTKEVLVCAESTNVRKLRSMGKWYAAQGKEYSVIVAKIG